MRVTQSGLSGLKFFRKLWPTSVFDSLGMSFGRKNLVPHSSTQNVSPGYQEFRGFILFYFFYFFWEGEGGGQGARGKEKGEGRGERGGNILNMSSVEGKRPYLTLQFRVAHPPTSPLYNYRSVAPQ